MKNSLFAIWLVVVGVFVVPAPVLAHHSAANYDEGKQITLQGTVTRFRFANPHPLVYFQAKDEAGTTKADWKMRGLAI